MTNDDEGEGGVTIPPKIDDVIYEQPLINDDDMQVACFAMCIYFCRVRKDRASDDDVDNLTSVYADDRLYIIGRFFLFVCHKK